MRTTLASHQNDTIFQRRRYKYRRSHPRSTNTSDPESEAARVFVGGVPPGADQDALEKMFEKHGKVKGVSVFKGEVEKFMFSVEHT